MRAAVPFDKLVAPQADGCHLWAGPIGAGGYGVFKNLRAHRYAYERKRGPIPTGLVIDHMCRVRRCVNPEHLRAVTLEQNALENSESVPAINARKTHCKRGHPLTGCNIYKSPKLRRGRACRICKKMQTRESKVKLKPLNRGQALRRLQDVIGLIVSANHDSNSNRQEQVDGLLRYALEVCWRTLSVKTCPPIPDPKEFICP